MENPNIYDMVTFNKIHAKNMRELSAEKAKNRSIERSKEVVVKLEKVRKDQEKVSKVQK